MIIPIRCFTCSSVLADKYRYYLQEVRQKKLQENGFVKDDVEYLTRSNLGKKTAEGQVLDQLKLFNPCCRRHFLTQVDII